MERAGELIESIVTSARELSGADLSAVALHDLGSLLTQVEQARAAVDAAANAVLDRFDARGAASFDGLRSTNAWLRQRCQMTGATAARRVRTARSLRQLAEVSEGFRSGRFSADQADLFSRSLTPRTADAMTEDEAVLASLADGLGADDLARELRGWAEMVDTDGAEPDPGHRDRGFTFVATLDGAWTGRLDLSAGDGLLLNSAVEGMAEALRASRESAAGTRSRTQRRADALLELVRRGCGRASGAADASGSGDTASGETASDASGSGDTASGDAGSLDGSHDTAGPPSGASVGSPRAAPRVTLYLTLDGGDLEGGRGADTLSGQHLDPDATDRLLCDCAITRVLSDPMNGARLEFGRRRRVVSPAQRSALALRDRGCSFPGCTAPPEECDAHHIVHWRRGGLTNLPNLTLVCSHHHSLVHEDRWSVGMTPAGPRWARPDGSTVDERPGWTAAPAMSPSRPSRGHRPGRAGRRWGDQPAATGRDPSDPGADHRAADNPDTAELARLARERAARLRPAA